MILNAIAAGGGTGNAYLVDADAQATDNFVDALNEIRHVAVACEYQIPSVQGTILYDLVNVTFKADGQPVSALGYVGNAASCTNGGWHYDDVNNPKSIVMCKSSCDALQAIEAVTVEIVYGCETVIK